MTGVKYFSENWPVPITASLRVSCNYNCAKFDLLTKVILKSWRHKQWYSVCIFIKSQYTHKELFTFEWNQDVKFAATKIEFDIYGVLSRGSSLNALNDRITVDIESPPGNRINVIQKIIVFSWRSKINGDGSAAV